MGERSMNDLKIKKDNQRKIHDSILKPYYERINHEDSFLSYRKGKSSKILKIEIIEKEIVNWPGYKHKKLLKE